MAAWQSCDPTSVFDAKVILNSRLDLLRATGHARGGATELDEVFPNLFSAVR
jgi:hypothetical protein